MSKIRKGYVKSSNTNNGTIHNATVVGYHGDEHADIEVYQSYGFAAKLVNEREPGKPSSSPDALDGAPEGLIVDMNGINVLIAAEDRRYKPLISNQGDVMVYTNRDMLIYHRVELAKDNAGKNIINIAVGNSSFVLSETGDITLTCTNLIINGNVQTTGTLKNNNVNVGSTHVHGGVTAGAGNTAVPH